MARSRLYHYTSLLHWHVMVQDKVIETTDNMLHKGRKDFDPAVVWLTDEWSPRFGWEPPNGPLADRTQVRITVEVSSKEVYRWRAWANRRQMDRYWKTQLAEKGNSKAWYVIERPIPVEEWMKVVFRYEDLLLYDPESGFQRLTIVDANDKPLKIERTADFGISFGEPESLQEAIHVNIGDQQFTIRVAQ